MVVADTFDKKICSAIKVIVDKAIAAAGYNKTIVGTVTARDGDAYKIKYQDSSFYAYSIDDQISYAKGDIVYVLFLNNDTKLKKIILTKVR